jgi:hypothetical protein
MDEDLFRDIKILVEKGDLAIKILLEGWRLV